MRKTTREMSALKCHVSNSIGATMIITTIGTFPLRMPFNLGTQVAASAWREKGLPAADALLVRVDGVNFMDSRLT